VEGVAGERLMRIGEAAALGGVSCRTLRYYEERGMLVPASHSPRGARRYARRDLERLARIRELQDVMGLNLDAIQEVLSAEDRLEELRVEYRREGISPARRRDILAEAMAINDRLRASVDKRVARLEEVLEELGARAKRYRELAAQFQERAQL